MVITFNKLKRTARLKSSYKFPMSCRNETTMLAKVLDRRGLLRPEERVYFPRVSINLRRESYIIPYSLTKAEKMVYQVILNEKNDEGVSVKKIWEKLPNVSHSVIGRVLSRLKDNLIRETETGFMPSYYMDLCCFTFPEEVFRGYEAHRKGLPFYLTRDLYFGQILEKLLDFPEYWESPIGNGYFEQYAVGIRSEVIQKFLKSFVTPIGIEPYSAFDCMASSALIRYWAVNKNAYNRL